MPFALPDSGLSRYVYRSDKFTPKALVTHAGNKKPSELAKIDLLPKLEGKVLLTKELAPIFRGREQDMQENFSTLIAVLDGKGFVSDSGMQGQRGYDRKILFKLDRGNNTVATEGPPPDVAARDATVVL